MVGAVDHRFEVEALARFFKGFLQYAVSEMDGVAVAFHIAQVGAQSVGFGVRFRIAVLIVEMAAYQVQHNEIVDRGINRVEKVDE